MGDIDLVRIFHDNSGNGKMASWFLKFILVHDLQTREKYYFICNKWLAVDKEDGAINRILPVCGMAQKTGFKYLFEKQTKEKLSDDHIWFSILNKPMNSSFTRADRLTCCFVLLFMSMLMNIMYYGVLPESEAVDGIKIGPITLTIQQVKILW